MDNIKIRKYLQDLLDETITVEEFQELVMAEIPSLPSWLGGNNPSQEQKQKAIDLFLNTKSEPDWFGVPFGSDGSKQLEKVEE